jgi:putative Flp pilus-assembly TadE/G-like protein
MHNLLRCRRGSAALATVAALVPLIGVVALGAEAGSWYVTKQHAQNAADAAAISGGLRLACSISGSSTCDTAQDYVYRGKQFADKNKFCDPRDTSSSYLCVNSPPTDTSQTVQIDQPTGDRVRAIVSQHQPVSGLTKLLGLFPGGIDIGAQAIAKVQQPKELCGLGLGRYSGSGSPTSALSFAGSTALSGNGCGFQSDNTVKYASAPSFNGTGWAVYASNGCVNSGTCDPGVPYNYYSPPAANPLARLDTMSFNTVTMSTPGGSGNPCGGSGNATVGNTQSCTILPNTLTTAYNRNLNVTGGTATSPAGGTYFFNGSTLSVGSGGTLTLGSGTYYFNGGNLSVSNGGTLTLGSGTPLEARTYFIDGADLSVASGGTLNLGAGTYFFRNSSISFSGTVTGTNVNIVMLGNSKLSITGGPVNLSANFNNTDYPDLNGVLIADLAPNRSNLAVTINGSAGVTMALGGAMYFPNVDVTMSGNSQNANTDCSMVIANSITFGGGANYLSTKSCASGTVDTNQVVVLVQ